MGSTSVVTPALAGASSCEGAGRHLCLGRVETSRGPRRREGCRRGCSRRRSLSERSHRGRDRQGYRPPPFGPEETRPDLVVERSRDPLRRPDPRHRPGDCETLGRIDRTCSGQGGRHTERGRASLRDRASTRSARHDAQQPALPGEWSAGHRPLAGFKLTSSLWNSELITFTLMHERGDRSVETTRPRGYPVETNPKGRPVGV